MQLSNCSFLPPSADVCLKTRDASVSFNLSNETISSEESEVSKITQHQLIKQVNKWFQGWKPWQQKTLLCGITNRCSTQQLETLATTLEPVFHRDFVTIVRCKYPSAGFKKKPVADFHPGAAKPHVYKSLRELVLQQIVVSQHHNAWASHRAPLASPESLARSQLGSGVAHSVDSIGFIRNHQHQRSVVSSRKHSCVDKATKSVTSSKRLYRKSLSKRSRPHDDLLKVQRSSLARQYRQQLMQIWQWISDWKEHEAMMLMVDVVKSCFPEIQNYLAQCLYQRLRERIDINWLPDQILLNIFSKLSIEDVQSAEKVCLRWKHLFSGEDLWRYKCQEFGLKFGISDLLTVIKETLPNEATLDWRLAFLELSQMTEDTQTDISESPEIRTNLSISPHKSLDESEEGFFEKERYNRTKSQKSKLGHPKIASELARESSRLKRGLPPSKFLRTKMASDMFDRWPSVSPTCLSETTEEDELSRDFNPSEDDILRSPVKSIVESVVTYGPLMGSITSSKQREENLAETALDVRMDLTQAPDLLGNYGPDLSLSWKTASVDGDTPLGMQSPDFSSTVQPIVRVRKLLGHMDAVSCIEVDFRRLISGSHDRTIRVWDIRSGRSIHKLYGHKGRISSLKFSNNVLYTASWDTTIMVWNLVTFQRKAVLNGHGGSISCLQLTSDFLVSGSHDRTLRVWSLKSLICVRVIEGHQSHILCLHCDNLYAFSGSSDNTVRQTLIRSGECLRVFSTFSKPIHHILVRHHLLITTSEDGQISFCNTESGILEAVIQAHEGAVNAVGISQGHLYTAGSDHSIKEWDLSSMTCVRSLVGHKMDVLDLKVSQRRIISASADSYVRIWETRIPSSSQAQPADLIPLQIVHQADIQKQNH